MLGRYGEYASKKPVVSVTLGRYGEDAGKESGVSVILEKDEMYSHVSWVYRHS